MKKLTLFAVFTGFAIITWGQTGLKGKGCDLGVTLNAHYSRAAVADSILKHYTEGMLPGVSLAVYSETEGWWYGSAGYASLEKKIPMDNCHLQYLQSVSKSFVAVEILQLREEGKIDIDQPITRYLPARFSRYVPQAERMTVRMLLNHQSGVPEYNEQSAFVSKVILHPLDPFTSEQCLSYIAQEPLQFEPGTKYKYTNTNYLILSLIGDALTGDHAAWIRKHIFEPLGMKNSYYGKDHQYLNGLYLPESYQDALNIGKSINVTPFQKMTVFCSKGDDGIVCTSVDAVKYLKGLMEGKLLNEASMKDLLNFVKDENGHNRYGMGIIYFDLGGIPAYGHGGGGIGAGCGLIYVPAAKTYIFMSTNIGCFIDSKLSEKANEMRMALLAGLLQ